MFGCRFTVVSDNEAGTVHDIAPDDLAKDAPNAVLAHYGELHYENTIPLKP